MASTKDVDSKSVERSSLDKGNDVDVSVHPTKIDVRAERTITRKFDLYLLVLLAFFYLCNALDKTNLANAKTNGFDKDIGLVGNQYYQLITAFYAPFCVFGAPISILIKRFSAARVLPIMALSFGVLSMVSAAVKTFAHIMTIRVFLAVAEAACLPGVIYYLSSFYTRIELASRLGIFYAATSIAGAFGGLIAWGVFQLHSHLRGWQILFLLEGGITLSVATMMALVLPKSVKTASFLTPEQRILAEKRMLRDSSSEVDAKMDVRGAIRGLMEWPTAVWIGMELCIGVPLASVSNFLPQVVARLGYSTVKTNLYTVAPNVVGALCLVGFSQSSDYFRERSIHLIAPLALTMLGFIILGSIDVLKHLGVSYFACFLLCMGSFTPSVLACTWAANNTLDENKRVILVGVMVGFGNAAGLVSSNVFRAQDEPKYILALVVSAAFGGAAILFVAGFGAYMRYDNRRRNNAQGVNWKAQDVHTSILAEGRKNAAFRWMY